jgi:hypothetical protein
VPVLWSAASAAVDTPDKGVGQWQPLEDSGLVRGQQLHQHSSAIGSPRPAATFEQWNLAYVWSSCQMWELFRPV